MRVREFLLGEYQAEWDKIGPGFRDIQYPALVILLENGQYIVYDYEKLDKLFSGITGMLAAQKIKTETKQKEAQEVKV